MRSFQVSVDLQLVQELVQLQGVDARKESAAGSSDLKSLSPFGRLFTRHEADSHRFVDH